MALMAVDGADLPKNGIVFKDLKSWRKLLDIVLDRMINNTLPSLSSSCRSSINTLTNVTDGDNIESLPLVRMLDAWGKVPAGLLLGNLLWTGSYHECMDIPAAHYCLNRIGPVTHGSCFPRGCSKNDVATIFKTAVSAATNYSVSVELLSCDDYEWNLTTGAIATFVVLGIILFLCIAGTAVEILTRDKTKPSTDPSEVITNKSVELKDVAVSVVNTPVATPITHPKLKIERLSLTPVESPLPLTKKRNICVELLVSFSLAKNTRDIFSMKSPKGAITSINGIRVISMTWVILGHYYSNLIFGFGFGSTTDNVLDAFKVMHRFAALPITNAFVAVDSFFLLSGLLTAYVTLRKVSRGTGSGLKLGDVLMMYVHRYIRLTPSLVVVILFYTNLLPFTYAGPRSAYARDRAIANNSCYDHWWTNLLYINNFFSGSLSDGCLAHTWYLANDMQFAIVAPGIMILMLFVQKKTSGKRSIINVASVLGSMCLISMLITGILTGVYDIPTIKSAAGFPGNPRAARDKMESDWLYLKPYSRIPPYLVGMFLGYLLSRNDGLLERKKGQIVSIAGWVLATVLALLVVYGPWKVFKEPHPVFFGDMENIMYAACHRFVWSCAVGWVIFACHNNRGGVVNSFLSWKGWIPWGKLTYSAYLVHLMVFGGDGYFMVSREGPVHFQDSFAISEFISNVVLSYFVAFILAVSVEYPVLNLEKIIFKR